MVFGSTMLEVAIGMIFVYLLMSLLCSAFGELINSLLRFRSKDLEKGIRRLLDNTPIGHTGFLAPLKRFHEWINSPRATGLIPLLRRFQAAYNRLRDRTVVSPRGGAVVSSLAVPKLSDKFFSHPLIKPLFEGRKPSYIPARTFSLALWNMATEAAKEMQKEQGIVAPPPSVGGVITSPPTAGIVIRSVEKDLTLLRNAIELMPNDVLPKEIQQALLTHMDEAEHDFDKARENVEKWYDDTMDRVSGSFRRRAQYILLTLGFLLALAINVDSFNIIKALSNNDDLRKTVVTAAEKYANEPLPGTTPTPTPTPITTTTTTTPGAGATGAGANGAPTPSPSPTPTAEEQFAAARERIKQIKGEINELGLPIGWDCGWRDPNSTGAPGTGTNSNSNGNTNSNTNTNTNANINTNSNANANQSAKTKPVWKCSQFSGSNLRGVPDGWSGWLFKLMGIFLTALAVSQGAPFWFDLLNKIIVIRSTVKPREKSQDEGSKDKKPTTNTSP
jgi:hypothetical protein